MSKIINYSLGATFKGSYSKICTIILLFSSILFFFLFIFYFFPVNKNDSVPIELLVFLFFIVLIFFPIATNIRGTFINLETREYKSYRDILFYKIGEWKPMGSFNQLVLSKFLADTDVVFGKQVSNNPMTRTYDLCLITDYETIILKEFIDYQEAWKFLEEHGQILNISTKDEIALNRKNKLNKKNRRR